MNRNMNSLACTASNQESIKNSRNKKRSRQQVTFVEEQNKIRLQGVDLLVGYSGLDKEFKVMRSELGNSLII